MSGTDAEPGIEAWSLNHLGFATWAPARKEVLNRVPRKLDAHLQWMAEHQLLSQEAHSQRVEVMEEISGHEPLFGHDRQPATVDEIDLAVVSLRAGHQDLIECLNDAPGAFLDWEPPYRRFAGWADWRTVAATLAHLANVESHYYLAMIGYEAQGPTVTSEEDWRDYLPSVRNDTVDCLASLRSSADRARVQ
ncbi:MAG TPA: hypothetical protein VM848_05405, partial [Acidimicrobiia bacterium]|nr:hypothetical protein [Acidimicrobiia bacterium]